MFSAGAMLVALDPADLASSLERYLESCAFEPDADNAQMWFSTAELIPDPAAWIERYLMIFFAAVFADKSATQTESESSLGCRVWHLLEGLYRATDYAGFSGACKVEYEVGDSKGVYILIPLADEYLVLVFSK